MKSAPASPATLAIEALAVARLTRLVTEDRVPFGPLRDRILERADANSGGLGSADKIAELVTCPWCMSVWIALAVIFLRRIPGWRTLARALAASEVAGFLAAHDGD